MPPSFIDPQLASLRSSWAMVHPTSQCRAPEHYNFFYNIYCTSTQTSFSLCPVCVFFPVPFCSLSRPFYPSVTTPACSTRPTCPGTKFESHRYLIQHLGNMISLMIALVDSGKKKMVVIQSDLAVNIQQTVLLLMIRITVSPNEENSYLKPELYKEGAIRKAFCIFSAWVSGSGWEVPLMGYSSSRPSFLWFACNL